MIRISGIEEVFSRVLRDSTPRFFFGPSVHRSVCPLVILFLGFCGLWPYYSCLNDEVTIKMAPAHPCDLFLGTKKSNSNCHTLRLV